MTAHARQELGHIPEELAGSGPAVPRAAVGAADLLDRVGPLLVGDVAGIEVCPTLCFEGPARQRSRERRAERSRRGSSRLARPRER